MAACGLRLAALHNKGDLLPDIDMVMYTATCMGGHGPGPAARSEERAAGKNPSCQSVPRLAVSIRFARSQALVVSSRPVTSRVHPAARNHLFPSLCLCLPWPCPSNLWEINPPLVARESPRKLASAASVPAIQWSIDAPTSTHPSTPQFLRCSPRPAYDAMPFVSGSGGAWVLRPGLRNTTSRTQPAPRSSGVRMARGSPGLVARRAKETS